MTNRNQNRRTTTHSAGYSLLELVLAVALVAGTLVPALELVREGMAASETTDQRSLMANYAVCKLEEQLALVAATWATGDVAGDLSADGHSDLRYTITRSDATADGGIEGELMHIRVTTYIDEDGDDALDADEPRCQFRTKIGRFASYEFIATS